LAILSASTLVIIPAPLHHVPTPTAMLIAQRHKWTCHLISTLFLKCWRSSKKAV